MSKIETIKPNYQPKSNLNNEMNPNFGKGPVDEKLVGELVDSFKSGMMTKKSTVYDFLAMKEGEIESQLINNLFTATLAPTMIALNPFSDKPKKDKQYVAFRQFVSVLIALGFTAPLTLLVNKQIATIGSEGYIDGIDIRMAKHKDYLHKDFKKAYKNVKTSADRQKFEQTVGLTDKNIIALRDSNNPIKKMYYKAYLEKSFVDRKNSQSSDFFNELVSKNIFDKSGNIITQVDEKTGDILLLDNKGKPSIRFQKGSGAKNDKGLISILDDKGNPIKIVNKKSGEHTLTQDIPRINTIEDLKGYISKNSLHKRTFGEFMRDNFGFEFYSDGKKIKPEATLEKLRNIGAKEFLETFGIVEKADGEDLRKLLSSARQKQTVENIRQSVPVKTENFVTEMAKQNMRDNQAQMGEKAIKDANMSLNQLINRLNLLGIDGNAENVKAEKLSKIQALMNKPIAEAMEDIKRGLVENNFSEALKKENGIDDISKRFMKKFTSILTENFKNTSKLYSLGVAAGITVVACTILNWTYPRMIEKFFPSLLVKDKPSDAKKGGSK